ncbi:PAS domain S-box protein [bacterium]|nr:PAS domain S-box protein [bacterium]
MKQKETEMEKSGAKGAEGPLSARIEGGLPKGEGGNNLPEEPCFVVGIGASAGGQAPLEHLFTVLPADCNLSFVVVVHLPPDGPDLLADLLRRYTSMEVLTAEDGAPLLPNSVHVVPPGACLSVSNGRLKVEMMSGMSALEYHPIDRLFTSLAADFGERAIAVVLSGFGMDGARGVRMVKEMGGTVLVQQPGTAINSPMPENAIATGATDLVLAMEEIPVKLAEIARGHCGLSRRSCRDTSLDEDLDTIFTLLKSATGNDFSTYKRNTVMRRIERRMTVNESGGLRKYIALLEQTPREAEALAREILIGVTRFFRDPEAFETLRNEVIPRLFAGRDPDDQVRIWHACCSTGEEAYSVAMLVREHLDREARNARVQIFATDIDEAAVAQGRSGFYTDDIGPDVGEERLRGFFTRHMDRRRVVKELREMILFAGHNIIKDPPFSRLDLLVCRNFLIYLNPDMQKRLISLFHLVLKPGGFLFLGASEAVGADSDLFAPVDKKWKIFQRMECGRRTDSPFPFTAPVRKLTRTAVTPRAADSDGPTLEAAADRLLVGRFAPPSLVVNENYEVLYISSRTRPYLEDPVGEPTVDILKKAREELRPALRAAIYKSFAERKQVVFRGVKLTNEEEGDTVNVTVEPLPAHPSYGELALVVLEPVPSQVVIHSPAERDAPPEDESSSGELLVRQLEEQLRITHEQLQLTTEQLETTNEGFMATNEELMSINEEFQSANEELEASKEELQALNEELITVNAELQGKVEELHQVNGDMENLFSSSGIATIFLDRRLIIKRFSPAMAGILNLIPADMGRPFRHLSGTIDWPGFSRDADEVLKTQSPIEREVTSREDARCFSMRILPYLTTDGKIDGIVITLVDITDLKRAEEQIRSAAQFPLENPSPVLRVGRDGTLLFANKSSCPLLSKWRTDFGEEIPEPLRQSVEESLADGVSREFDLNLDGCVISFAVSPFPERDYANLYGRDITKRKQAEESLRRAKEEWERTFDSVPDLITILDNEHRVLRVNAAMARRLTHRHEECVGRRCYEVIHGTCVPPELCPHLRTIEDGHEHIEELHVDSLGGDFLVTTTPLLDKEGGRIGSVHIARDITERKRMEEALRKSEVRLKRAQEIAHLGSWELDLVNNNLSWSDEVYRILGFQPQEFVATYEAFLEAVHPEDRTAVDAAYAGSLSEGKNSYEITHRIVRKSTGDIRIVQEKCEHVRDDSGSITRSVGMVQDITERAQAEMEILRYVDELERFNRATVGRELRMVELKKEVNELRGRLGEGPGYSLDFVEE